LRWQRGRSRSRSLDDRVGLRRAACRRARQELRSQKAELPFELVDLDGELLHPRPREHAHDGADGQAEDQAETENDEQLVDASSAPVDGVGGEYVLPARLPTSGTSCPHGIPAEPLVRKNYWRHGHPISHLELHGFVYEE
jgi:hypothetical protein